MPSAKKPEITSGQSLDVQPGISNIGENRAALEALKNANIDGQDTYPQSVSTKRLAADDINVSGLMKSGTMLVGSGGVTVTSDADGGTPATGLHIGTGILQLIKSGVPQVTLNGGTGDATFIGAITATSGTFTGTVNATAGYFVGSITIGTDTNVGVAATGTWLTNTQLLMKYGGTTKVNLNTSTNTYYVKGEIYAEKFTVISNAANSVVFGVDVTIGGNLILNTTLGKKLYFDGSGGSNYIEGYNNGSGYVFLHGGSGVSIGSGSFGAAPYMGIITNNFEVNVTQNTNTANYIDIYANAASSFALKRGGTAVMSYAGNSSTVTFSGFVITAGISSSASLYGAHKTSAGTSLADGTYTAFGISLTVVDGLIVSQTGFTVS